MTSAHPPEHEPWSGQSDPYDKSGPYDQSGPYGPSAGSSQPVPAAAYGTGHAPYPVAARRHRAMLIVVLALVVVVVLAGAMGGAMYVNNIGPFKDSGLAMCERMRDAKQTGDTFPVPLGRMTEDNYRQLRGDFADSRYADIRDAGTRFVDLLWQLSGGRPADMLGMVLMLGGPIIQSYSSLSGACTAHGVTIPPLTGR